VLIVVAHVRIMLDNMGQAVQVPVAARSEEEVCGLSPAESVVSNPTGCMDVCVLSRIGFFNGLIIRPEESYRLWCVVVCDLETS
jgi:hypothetical protein